MVGAIVISGVSLLIAYEGYWQYWIYKEVVSIKRCQGKLVKELNEHIPRLIKEKDERHALDLVNLQKLMGEYADSVLDIENRLTSLESSERMKPNAQPPRATVKNWKQFRSLAEQEAAQESN